MDKKVLGPIKAIQPPPPQNFRKAYPSKNIYTTSKFSSTPNIRGEGHTMMMVHG